MTPELGRALLAHARWGIESEFRRPRGEPSSHPLLETPGATFVTLRQDGRLRGCIGSLEPRRPLRVDVRANAVAAAFSDPRFPPLADHEVESTSIEVSLLSPSERVPCCDETDLASRLVPGIDGVTIAYRSRRATFLPQVWEALPDCRAFLAELRAKAGLPADFWHPELAVSRYRVTKFTEGEMLAGEDS
jgi:uncharacterized protein